MADLALYRKYRPQSFDNLVGQEAIRTTLLNATRSGHLSHGYLFCGPRGTGKTTTARLVAKAINCISPTPEGEPCNKCEYCTLMNEGRLMDIIEIDAASNRGIDEIRDLREKIKFAPNQAPHKVYIIDEVHMLTPPAFNALLKTLEEPPAHAYFILATTEIHKIPETIISRCQRFDFHRIEEDVIVERLRHIAKQEQIETEDEALKIIARSAEGGMRDAISLFEQIVSDGKLLQAQVVQVLGLTGHHSIHPLFEALQEKDAKVALAEIQNVYKEGADLSQFTREFLNLLRTHLLDSLGKKEVMVRILRWVRLFQEAGKELRYSMIPELPLEVAVIKACLTEEEEAKTGWFGGILGGKKEPTEKAKKEETVVAKKEALPVKDGLKTIPQEAPAPIETASGPAPELSAEILKQYFPRILEQIATPSIRQSFKTGVFSSIEGQTVLFEFQSKFHLEKANTTPAKSEIEKAFAHVFKSKIKMDFRLSETAKLVDATLEVFGGELIE
ncbi:MAG: DNA polymerase III subunit gamma/tau [Candidatus Gracilibacteria bacterium]